MRLLLSHPIMILLVIVLVIVFFISLNQSEQRAASSNEEIVELEQEVAQIENSVDELEQQLEVAGHPITKEKVIRDELLLQKEGEYVFQLPEIEIEEKPVEVAETPTPWQQWKEVLFN